MSAYPLGKTLTRETLVVMLRAALESGEHRFARQAALAWLAAFPGDLEVTLMHAQALLDEGKIAQAIPALETVCRKDPFMADAYRLLARACQVGDPLRYAFAVTSLYALGFSIPAGAPVDAWGEPLRLAVTASQNGQNAEAETQVTEVLRINPDLLLAAVLHLQADRATHEALTTLHLAEIYHSRWPECLPVKLILAEAHLEQGSEPEAVHLLHLCAASDTTGQTARRLWGENHPYRSLWSEDLVILFEQPAPAGVAWRLGWNRLAAGEVPANVPALPDPLKEAPAGETTPQDAPVGEMPWPESAGESAEAQTAQDASDSPTASVEGQNTAETAVDPLEDIVDTSPLPYGAKRGAPRMDIEGITPSVGAELERLAKKLKQDNLARVDGRHPVYVILSSRRGLEDQYGPQTAGVLEGELHKLAEILRYRPGWTALVYYPDDAECTAQFGLTPVNPRDPWKIKNALSDLDVALRQRGEMIGALLIAGGDAVVPFHRLPNPTDDPDGEVFSDSPYATLDANYFVPEWPVGRLPGEAGPDAALLLYQLHAIQRFHGKRKKSRPVLGIDWVAWVGSLVENFLPSRKAASFGYTAAVWRRSSLAVFRPVGAPHTVKASPPEHSGSVDRERIAVSSLGYYNLHGLEDSPEWYGQRDPLERGDLPDYPVALAPTDLKRNGRAPRVIFSEACYGAHIFGKSEQESLALKFLSMGALAVIGSTCTAYGSINTPLIAADLLGNMFWQHLKSGRSAGEALMQAKIDLVREMNHRQGFLDGEDQKTLISFVLYGDPLAGYDGFRVQAKSLRMKTHPLVKTIPDQPEAIIPSTKVKGEVISQVKSIVAEYLPGADLAEIHFTRQDLPASVKYRPGTKNGHGKKNGASGEQPGRMVVTVSKRVVSAEHTHHHIMRVTLDEEGKAVKLSLSR